MQNWPKIAPGWPNQGITPKFHESRNGGVLSGRVPSMASRLQCLSFSFIHYCATLNNDIRHRGTEK
jgi:hypothetical protein